VEDEETLQTRAVVGNTADLVEDLVNELLSDGVVATGVVVRGILLSGDHVLGVEEGSVRTSADLVDNVGLQIGVDGTRDVLALACGSLALILDMCHIARRTGLGEEGAETMVVVLGLALLSEVAIGLDTVLEAVELIRSQYKFARGGQASAIAPVCAFEAIRGGKCVNAYQTYLPARVGDLATGLAD
jgi:hypothetical protein